jgi:tetratricopeptide (TPR) repeat protein
MLTVKWYQTRLTAFAISLVFLIDSLPLVQAADESVAQGVTPTPPASVIKPGRPHGGQHDPHAQLGPEKLITVALQHRAEGRYPEALDVMDQAISKYPKNAELFTIRGSLRLEQNRLTEALQDLETAAKLDPTNPAILVNRAQAYKGFGRNKDALQDLDRAIELNPDFLAARFNRGAMYHSQGKLKKALADFNHCIAVEPHLAAPYFNRASTYEALGQKDNAIADFKRFIELSDNKEWKETAQQLLDKLEASNKQNKNTTPSNNGSG